MKTESNDRKKFPVTLTVLQALRTTKGSNDRDIHPMLDKAFNECCKNGMVLMLERVMLHIGDISRQHNLLNELGIKSPTSGAQERETFRSILRWWSVKLPESFKRNIRVIVEFTVLDNLMFYQNTTDRNTGKHIKTEILFPNVEVVYDYLASQIRTGKNINLIAKHLPKYMSGKSRTTKKVIKTRKDVESFEWTLPEGKSWVKLNGKFVKGGVDKITVKTGDVVSYPRNKQSITLDKQKVVNEWILGFCMKMDWSIGQYKDFRKLQNTAEQALSSKSILDMAKSDFMEFLNKLTTGQRFKVSKTVCYKDGDVLKAKEKWGELGNYFIEWENGQEKIADKLRDAASNDDVETKEKLMKEYKVKSTGIQTVDLLSNMLKGNMTEQMINNTYQSMIEKMDLIANVFPIIDGSGSMGSSIIRSYWGTSDVTDSKYSHISNWQVAASLAIAFSTRNPVQEFRNTFGWFSSDFKIIGKSKYVNDAPNDYVSSSSYTKKVNEYNILSEKNTFTENFNKLTKSNPGIIGSTNMFASIQHFVKLVKDGKVHSEDLPNALLYITDMENNTGKSPKEAVELAYSIGWKPLMIFWGIQRLPETFAREIKGIPNILLVSGFSEGVLSQILRGIKKGSVNPEDELFSIFEDKRYSVIS
jgi:hypothetical protein